jgi:pentatricopeptide repeat protein
MIQSHVHYYRNSLQQQRRTQQQQQMHDLPSRSFNSKNYNTTLNATSTAVHVTYKYHSVRTSTIPPYWYGSSHRKRFRDPSFNFTSSLRSLSQQPSILSSTTSTDDTNVDYDEDNNEDEIAFYQQRGRKPPRLNNKSKNSGYMTVGEEREIRHLNRKHRNVRIARQAMDGADENSSHNPHEQREMRQLQQEQLQDKHYNAAQQILQLGRELLHNDDTNNNSNTTMTESTTANKKKNYSSLLQAITSFTHSYFMLVNHHRVFKRYSYLDDNNNNNQTDYWRPHYRAASHDAINVSMDLLQYVVEQKLLDVQRKQQRLKKKQEKDDADRLNLLKYGVNIQDAYINEIHNNNSNPTITTNSDTYNDENDIDDDDDDGDETDSGSIFKNDTMWLYNPGIIYNPLIQIWKHMSLHPNHHLSPVRSTIETPEGRIVAPELAASLAITASSVSNNTLTTHTTMRSAEQTMEQLKQMILKVIEYTYYTNPSAMKHGRLLRKQNADPYKLFYNSTTFNMMLEVFMHQHHLDPNPMPVPSTKKRKKRTDNDEFYSNENPHLSESTASIMQITFTKINHAIRQCLQYYFPQKVDDGRDNRIAVLEGIVENYDKRLEEMTKQCYEFPKPPKFDVWQDDVEDEAIHMQELALQEAAKTGRFDANGNIVPTVAADANGNIDPTVAEEETIPATFTSNRPTTIPKVDNVGLGVLFRPDIHTYNLFMQTWALKCNDIKDAEMQVHRIYTDMQQDGDDLLPNTETHNIMFHFYSSHPHEYVHRIDKLLQSLIEKQGIRNVQLLHWYYSIDTFTQAQKHKPKAKEYLENMIYSSHHHKFIPKMKPGEVKDPYANVKIIAEDDDDLNSIAIIQRAAQLLMNMYRNEVKHNINVLQETKKYVTDAKQANATIENSTKDIEVAMRNAFDLYIKLKETGFLDFSGEERDDDGYLKYRDDIRTTFMDIYAYSGQTENAMKIFHRIVRTNVRHYTTLIDACGKNDDVEGAEAMYDLMIKDPNIERLNPEMYTILMNAYANSTQYPPNQLVDSITDLLNRMQNEPKCTNHSIRPDTQLYNSLLYSLYEISVKSKKNGDSRFLKAISILDEMEANTKSSDTENEESLVKPNLNTYLKTVQIGLQVRDFDGVLKIIERMALTPISETKPTKRLLNSESNHSILHMYREVNTFAALDQMIRLLNCLNQWADQKLTLLRPTAGSYSVLFKACIDLYKPNPSRSTSKCKTGVLIQRLYKQMQDENIKPNYNTYRELIDYYSQSKRREDLDYARDLLIEMEDKNDATMQSEERQYNSIFYGYLNNVGDTSAAVQILFRYTKRYLAYKIKDRPSGLLYQSVLFSYMESNELIKAALFVDQLHIMQQEEPLLKEVKGVTIKLDRFGVPHHLGPDVVVIDKLLNALKASTSIDQSDKDFYKRLLTKHSDAIKRFHRRRIRIKKKAFVYQ